MKKRLLRLTALILTAALIFSLPTVGAAPGVILSSSEISDVLDKTASFCHSQSPSPAFGSVGGEWTVAGIVRGECQMPGDYLENYYRSVVAAVSECSGVLSRTKYTEYSRLILALTAIGRDVSAVGAENLLRRLSDFDSVVKQGVTGPIYALIALDSHNYEIPSVPENSNRTTRGKLLDYILNRELSGGGFALSGSSPDPDVTAMALTALAPYRGLSSVREAVDRGLSALSSIQLPSGGFQSSGTENAESTAQVVIALSAFQVDCQTDPRFVKADSTGLPGNPLSALLKFSLADGAFAHTLSGRADLMATEQSLCALAAYKRYLKGKTSFFDMSDSLLIFRISSFYDISGHWAEYYISSTDGLGISASLSGYFRPELSVTRAEFATALVNALGLPRAAAVGARGFSDVDSGSRFYEAALAALASGVVTGLSDGSFRAALPVTREEAMAMLSRAAACFGKSASPEPVSPLSEFLDFSEISSWARKPASFCVSGGLMTGSGGKLRPKSSLTRAEAVAVIVRLCALLGVSCKF